MVPIIFSARKVLPDNLAAFSKSFNFASSRSIRPSLYVSMPLYTRASFFRGFILDLIAWSKSCWLLTMMTSFHLALTHSKTFQDHFCQRVPGSLKDQPPILYTIFVFLNGSVPNGKTSSSS